MSFLRCNHFHQVPERNSRMIEHSGKYSLEKNDNLEKLLTKMGVGLLKRKMASVAKQTVEVQAAGQEWTLVTRTPISVITWTFTLGQEHQLVTANGTTMKATFALEGNRLVQHTSQGDEADLLVVREFTGFYMIQHITHQPSGIKCTRTFKRV